MRWGWLILCAVLLGAWQHQRDVRHWWQHATGTQPVAVVGSGNVVVYTYDGCGGGCSEALQFFADAGLHHSEQNVSRDPAARAAYDVYHVNSMPLIVDGAHSLPGYDEEFLQQWYLQRPDNARKLAAFGLSKSTAVIYGTSWCEYCQQTKAYFTQHGIDFQEFDIEKDPAAAAQEKALFDGNPLPGVIYADVAMGGYSPQRLDAVREWTDEAGK